MALTPKERYLAIADELHYNPEISQSRKSLSSGLRIKSKIFAMLSKGQIVVKLPQTRVDELIERGEGERYESGGHPLREWVLIKPTTEEGWMGLVQEAQAFVDSQP
jgi:hypothetical protein